MESPEGIVWIIEIAAVLVLISAMLDGWRTGAVQGILRIVGFLAGILVAAQYTGSFSAEFPASWSKEARSIVAFLIILLAVYWVVSFIGATIKHALAGSPLGPVDRIGGAAIGLVKAMLIIAAIGVALVYSPINGRWRDAFFQSRAAGISMTVSGAIYRAARPYLEGPFSQSTDWLDRQIDHLRPDLAGRDVQEI